MNNGELKVALMALITSYQNRVGTTMAGAVRDVLSDLKHISDEEGLEFSERVDAAVEVALEEVHQKIISEMDG